MARTQRYKKIEKNVASSIRARTGRFSQQVKTLCIRIFRFFDSRLTIMIIPHSEGKVLNFQTNIFALSLGAVLIVGMVTSFFYFNTKSAGENAEISRLMTKNRETLASLDELRDENMNLLQAARRFQSSLSESLSLLGINQTESSTPASLNNSDLSSLFDTKQGAPGSVQESTDVKQLTAYLDGAVQPIEQIGKMLENQNNLFKEIPSIWPTSNPNAHISMQFGLNVHPITGQWYIHKGIDFSTYRSGDPVIATADGQVVTVGFDASFGNYIIIKHKHGIYTRYAHLSRSIVNKGQFVEQRTVIGYIGNTGVTTGPHLHYEVHIGSDVVDPAKYINVKFSN